MNSAALTNLTADTTIKINGREYTIVEVCDMTKRPNTARFISDSYIVAGKRGAVYSLDVRHNGSAFMTGATSSRIKEVSLGSVQVIAA